MHWDICRKMFIVWETILEQVVNIVRRVMYKGTRAKHSYLYTLTNGQLFTNCYIKMCSLSWSPVVRSRLKVLQIFHENATRMAGPSCKG